MAFTDWFKKAKEAKAKKEKPKNEYGNQGAGQKAYAEAQEALDEDEKKKEGGQYASND